MVQSFDRRVAAPETLARLAEAERQVELACEDVDDPAHLNQLKLAQFKIWEVRDRLTP